MVKKSNQTAAINNHLQENLDFLQEKLFNDNFWVNQSNILTILLPRQYLCQYT